MISEPESDPVLTKLAQTFSKIMYNFFPTLFSIIYSLIINYLKSGIYFEPYKLDLALENTLLNFFVVVWYDMK